MSDLQSLVSNPELVSAAGTQPQLSLHDICVQDVRYWCKQNIDICIPIPATAGTNISNSCRGEMLPISPNYCCSVNIICAEERLRTDCMGVDVTLGFQITLTPPNPLVAPVTIINHYDTFCFTHFIPFPTGRPISGNKLTAALKEIDGSCIVVQNLCCEIENGQCSRIHVQGDLIDKLWKYENLWIMAARPYGGITVRQEFPEPHAIGQCEECQVCD